MFHNINSAHFVRFNSDVSAKFLSNYEDFVDNKIKSESLKKHHQTFAASSFRCNRLSWFRLRGVEPDGCRTVSRSLQFKADVGTACHRIIQSNLCEMFEDDWISVKDYLSENPIDHNYVITEDEYESQIEFTDIPIRFACDGLIRINGKYYLVEIKTSELSSFLDLSDIKPEHIDQIKCYMTLLKLHDAIVIYQDRVNGDMKCYTFHITDNDMNQIMNRFYYVLDMKEKNLAPEGLPVGDKWCSNYCMYYKLCQEYGR